MTPSGQPLVLIVEDEAPLVTMLRYNLGARGLRRRSGDRR
jgi:hypothetical protein